MRTEDEASVVLRETEMQAQAATEQVHTDDPADGAACPIPQRTPWIRWTPMAVAELVLIAVAVAATWIASSGLQWAPELRWLFGYSAALILGQGLLRDLARLATRPPSTEPAVRMTCLCAESGLGVVLLLVGTGGLTLLGITQTATLTQGSLTLLVGALLLVGFVAKDYVLTIKRVEDHAAIKLW